MEAIKRIINKNSKKGRTCLNCGRYIEEELKDNTVFECPQCKQRQTIDIQGNRLVITVEERPELRCRVSLETKESKDIMDLRKQLLEALTDAHDWKEAAEGLARQIEDMHSR